MSLFNVSVGGIAHQTTPGLSAVTFRPWILRTLSTRRTVTTITDTANDIPHPDSNVKFKLLNNPPTIARISLSSSIPIYIRKNCLISMYSNNYTDDPDINNDNISLTTTFVNFWSTLYNHHAIPTASYHRLVVKNYPINALVSSNDTLNRGFQSTLYHLQMDGKTDWNIFGKDAILAFEQNSSLEVSPSRDKLQFNKYQNMNFQVLKGRGNVLLSGRGSILEVNLEHKYDKILVHYNNILAVNGVSQIDIKNSVSNRLLSYSAKTSSSWRRNPTRLSSSSSSSSSSDLPEKPRIFYYPILWIQSFVHSLTKMLRFVKYGRPMPFITISGPRKVLIQGNCSGFDGGSTEYNLEETFLDDDFVETVESAKVRKLKGTSRDYAERLEKSNLSYAIVHKNGKIEFKKTLSFIDDE